MKPWRQCIAACLPLWLAACAAPPPADTAQATLRVCADPNNLPFSNQAGEGFENRLAQMLASAMHEKVEFTWWAQRRGIIRNTLAAGRCDVVMGVPAGYGQAATTRPYYRSSYVFVYRKDRHYQLHALDDPRLATLKIGVHVLGSDNPPPAMLLAQRGIIDNVTGYSIYGDYRKPNPPAALVDAVARGAVDVAIAWGPMAAYFAERATPPLEVVPVDQPADSTWPMQFSIAMAVRRNDDGLRERLDAVLQSKRPQIEALLRQYGVPLLGDASLAGTARATGTTRR
jgi:quinoprotein dehydrogenase-associated probable ABC transporter substrate-binding protein